MRIYRSPLAGITWIDRGGGPVTAYPDHGEPSVQWTPPPVDLVVYDDDAHTGEDAVLAAARDRLTEAVGGSDLPAPAKAKVRAIIAEVLA